MRTIDDDLIRCFKRSIHKKPRFAVRFAELEDATGYKLGVVLRYLQSLKRDGVLEGFYPAISRLHFVKGPHFNSYLQDGGILIPENLEYKLKNK